MTVFILIRILQCSISIFPKKEFSTHISGASLPQIVAPSLFTTLFSTVSTLILFCAIIFSLVSCQTSEVKIKAGERVYGASDAVNLAQGWSQMTQDRVWFSSFGSRIIPYDWFLHLEEPQSQRLFRSAESTRQLGFLTQTPTRHNPDGLPVGFARDLDEEGNSWVGLTCAACHTGEVHYQGTKIRLSGGAAMIDYATFEAQLVTTLSATINNKEKFSRFAKRLRESQTDAEHLSDDNLHQALTLQLKRIRNRYAVNQTQVPYGYGRLDAFGQIFNAIAAVALNAPENKHTPDAPVSYPVLWNAPHLDVVQWNGSVLNGGPGPLFQNIVTALTVYGTIEIRDHSGRFGYPSSINFKNLGMLQEHFYQLKSPQWPQSILGKLDQARTTRGEKLYSKHCVSCHAIVDRSDDNEQLKSVFVPLDEIGTDPRMAHNFNNTKAKSKVLEGRRSSVLLGDRLKEEERSMDLVVHAAIGAIVRHPVKSLGAIIKGYHKVIKTEVEDYPTHYKARPLDGIWASAPYLHNGSVPNLYEMLLPPEKRSTVFHVGNYEFDIKKVGFITSAGDYTSVFDTRLLGNANTGHGYSKHLSENQRLDLLEYLKSL